MNKIDQCELMEGNMIKRSIVDFFRRYITVHVLLYLLVGIIFMNLMNYEEVFNTNEHFSNFRELDSPIVRASILFQIIRGFLVALIIIPFRETIMKSRFGWLMLFGVLFGGTVVLNQSAASGTIEGFIYTTTSFKEHLSGMPEVIVQSLGISYLFWLWERKRGQY